MMFRAFTRAGILDSAERGGEGTARSATTSASPAVCRLELYLVIVSDFGSSI